MRGTMRTIACVALAGVVLAARPAWGQEPGGTPPSPIPGRAIGIGAGWVLPADLTVPNAASVRLRLCSGLTFEGQLRVSWQGVTTTNEPDVGPGTTDADAIFTAGAGAVVRKPLATRGRFQLVAMAGASVSHTSVNDDPDGAANATTDTFTVASASWGFGIDWFFRAGWSISLSATNPLLSYTRDFNDGLFNDQIISSLEVGAIYDPTISAFVHLYY